jgi:hypothetical protein
VACLLAYALVGASPAQAHPVAQGAMDVVIFNDRVHVRATVSSEEVLVAAAYGGKKDASALDKVRDHGLYLLAHLHVSADGHQLDGRVVSVPEQAGDRPTYTFDFRFSAGLPGQVELRQDVLREFEFAPGNRWEASYLVRIGRDGQTPIEGLLFTCREPLLFGCDWHSGAGAPTVAVQDPWRMGLAFVRHGIWHILTGYDHLLFVTALLLAVNSLGDLVKVISAFTVAHTITLILSALDICRLPDRVVEPMIAGSILVVAVQNTFWPKQSRGWTRLLVAFLFGLFHGLGFAGGLLEAVSDMPAVGVTVAIAGFSAGVEIGHLAVVVPAFLLMNLVRRATAGVDGRYQQILKYGSILIAVAGAVYFVAALERV